MGNEVYNGDEEEEEYELFRFLNAIMYPHREDFMSTISEYIVYSDNEELWREVTDLSTIEQIRYEGLKEKAREEGMKLGREEGMKLAREDITEKVREEGIQAVILDNLEEQIPKERILMKLQKRFHLTEEKSKKYYEKFAVRES